MGILYVQGKLSHPRKLSLQHKLRFLVDTGAFFSVAPREILSMLKVSPIREETVQFADGRKARWKVGEVRLEVDGRRPRALRGFSPSPPRPHAHSDRGGIEPARGSANPEHRVADRTELGGHEVPDAALAGAPVVHRLAHRAKGSDTIERGAPVTPEAAVQDHLHVRFAGELAPEVLPEARLVARDDEEMTLPPRTGLQAPVFPREFRGGILYAAPGVH